MKNLKQPKIKKTTRRIKKLSGKKTARKKTYFPPLEDHDESIGIMNHRLCYKKGKRVPCEANLSSPFNLYYHKLRKY